MSWESLEQRSSMFLRLLYFTFISTACLIPQTFAFDQGPLSLYLDDSEGGDVSKRRLAKLQSFLQQAKCPVATITLNSDKFKKSQNQDIVFSALNSADSKSHRHRRVLNNTIDRKSELSSSILVRASTGIDTLESLSDVRFAFTNTQSTLGYFAPLKLLENNGVEVTEKKITFTQSELGSMTMLLHKDVFAAAIATPLADKWAAANDLTVIGKTSIYENGGVWFNRSMSTQQTEACQLAFLKVFTDQNLKSIRKVFPLWLSGMELVK